MLDNLSQGHREAVPAKATFVECDLRDRAAIDAIMAKHRPDAVMHFAAHSLVGESMKFPFQYLGANVINGINLLHSMIDHGVRRFILSSTANLFDAPQRVPIDEAEQIVPGSPYGESKFILERMLHWLDRIHGLRYATLRYFNAAGATQNCGEDHAPELHLIPLVLQVAQGQREAITIFGDDYRPPTAPACAITFTSPTWRRLTFLALGAIEQQSRVYNLGNGKGFSGERSGGGRAKNHRPPNSHKNRPPPRRRSAGADCQQRQNSPRAELETAIRRFARHHRLGLELAPAASGRIPLINWLRRENVSIAWMTPLCVRF